MIKGLYYEILDKKVNNILYHALRLGVNKSVEVTPKLNTEKHRDKD